MNVSVVDDSELPSMLAGEHLIPSRTCRLPEHSGRLLSSCARLDYLLDSGLRRSCHDFKFSLLYRISFSNIHIGVLSLIELEANSYDILALTELY